MTERGKKRQQQKLQLYRMLVTGGWFTWRSFRDAIGAKHKLSLSSRCELVRAVLKQAAKQKA